MKRVLVFDVNETLLDLSALDPHFQRVFGDAKVRVEWFGTMLQSALLTTITGPYVPFGEHFKAALAITGERHGLRVSKDDEQAILQQVRGLPPHPEVRPALERLRGAGFRLAALTNSTAQVEEAQLRHAGLADLFERALSADSAKRLKPAPEATRRPPASSASRPLTSAWSRRMSGMCRVRSGQVAPRPSSNGRAPYGTRCSRNRMSWQRISPRSPSA